MISWLRSWLATLDVLFDRRLMADLHKAEAQPDSEATEIILTVIRDTEGDSQ